MYKSNIWDKPRDHPFLLGIFIIGILITVLFLIGEYRRERHALANEQRQELAVEDDAKKVNQAANYLRECLLGCPRQCSSCGVLSYSCANSCDNFAQNKIINVNAENAESLLNDENSRWISCASACTTDFPNDENSYIDYECIHKCN